MGVWPFLYYADGRRETLDGNFESIFGQDKKKQSLLSEGELFIQGKKYKEALQCFERAAEMGSTEAMLEIAKLYLAGQFQPAEQLNYMKRMSPDGLPLFLWNKKMKKITCNPITKMRLSGA